MIYMTDTSLNFEELEDKIAGGGILPVACVDGKYKILLGKERFINHWRGSLKWSGFEGGRKVSENVHQMVSREFMEESLSMVPLKTTDEHNLEAYESNLTQLLKTKQYFARILLCIHHTNGESHEKRYHLTYVIEVPYTPECVEAFDCHRKHLIEFHYKLVVFKKLLDQLPKTPPFLRTGESMSNHTVKSIREVKLTDQRMTIHYIDADNTVHTYVHTIQENDKDICILYEKWYNTRKILHNIAKGFKYCPKAVQYKYDADGLLETASVNDEFLEKQFIRWWDIDDLKDVLKNGGFKKNEFFRAYFLPTLQRSIQELEKYKQSEHSTE